MGRGRSRSRSVERPRRRYDDPDSDRSRSRSRSRRSRRSRSRSRDRSRRERSEEAHDPKKRSRSKSSSRSPSPRRRHRSSSRGAKETSRSVSRDRDRERKSKKKHHSSSKDKKKSKKKDKGKSSRKRNDGSSSSDDEDGKGRKREDDHDNHVAELAKAAGFAGQDNPYGDTNLKERFVWHKKRQQEEKKGITEEESRRRDLSRREEIREELEKLRVRREQRELERQMYEQEMLNQQRLREMEMYGDLEAKEDEFHLEQAKTRAQIRIKEGRAKPIDILAMSMNLDNPEGEISIDEPYKIFDGLSLEEVLDLKNDIKLYLELEKASNLEFWQAMMVVCEDVLETLREEKDSAWKSAASVHSSVKEDIHKVLQDKTADQLEILRTSVVAKLESGKALDVEYWETLLKNLAVYKAKAKLRDLHENILKQRLEQLKDRQKREAGEALKEVASSLQMPHTEGEEESRRGKEGNEEIQKGDWSPRLIDTLPEVDDIIVLDEAEDWKQLLEKREQVKKSRFDLLGMKQPAGPSTSKSLEGEDVDELMTVNFQKLEGDTFDDDHEEAFNSSIPLENQIYLWQDKYRPRKPRYFNRVITGFEWNKYNKTHYDVDNPPPKVVFGYKFNIFYPHLIDKSVAPTYKFEKDPQSPDGSTVIIKFMAGPPYEEIAFRIVKKEWEHSHKRGFRCVFDKGILQLHFRFIRYRYRK